MVLVIGMDGYADMVRHTGHLVARDRCLDHCPLLENPPCSPTPFLRICQFGMESGCSACKAWR
ncbi:hypothetical protein RchiOBHm_Chr2g0098291 [Rosa chinensis]|uniref:Uncharacterized protein n=1 Tax=Rosa chinensis TaxID=74649 RepID=A0A2P6RLJ7_ROSCH|nr:hypothetical protein RchiOBHm_Chr2g0098291 [Rosa chinensis]